MKVVVVRYAKNYNFQFRAGIISKLYTDTYYGYYLMLRYENFLSYSKFYFALWLSQDISTHIKFLRNVRCVLLQFR